MSQAIAALQAAARRAAGNMGRVVPGGAIPAPRPAPLSPRVAPVARVAVPQVAPLPQEVVDALIRKVEAQGLESLTPDEQAALRATVAAREPVAVSVDDIAASVDGSDVPGDLTDVAPVADDLEASATPITVESVGAPNLTPNRRRVDPIANLAERIRQATTRADTESLAGMRRLQAEVDRLPDADRARLLEHPALAEGIESQAAKTNPEARAAAIANAKERLGKLVSMSEFSTTDRAAEQVASAATAREVAATPRGTPAARNASAADYEAAKQLLSESIPEADWNGILDAYSKLSPEQRRAVLASMPEEAGRFIEQMLDPNAEDFALLPNNVSRTLGPTLNPDGSVNPYSELILQLDEAKRAGDTQRYNDILLDIQKNPAGAADLANAQRDFIDRAQARDSLRRAIIGNDELVREAQASMVREAVLPPPRPNITPGARSIEVATEDLPARELPTAADTARAVEAERQQRLDTRAPGGGMPEADRAAAFGAEDTRDLPLAFRGRDRNQPFESRTIGSRLTDTNDANAIEKGIALEAEVQASLAEMRTAKGVQEMAAAQRRYQAAVKALDDQWPPRLVNPSTGEVRSISREELAAKQIPKGFVVERGKKAWTDSHLNKAGQQETFDGLVVAVVGGRPKINARMTRARPDMSLDERMGIREEVLGQYGEDDALDLLPDENTDEVVELGGRGKPARLGGAQQQSRVQDALQRLYGPVNPLAMTDASGKPLFTSAEAAAEDLLSKNTLFKPGTASYDLAREKITNALNDAYGPSTIRPAPDDVKGMPAAVQSEPGTTVTPGTSRNPEDIPALEGRRNTAGAAPEADSPGVPKAAPAPVDPAPNVTQNLDASGIDLSDPSGKPVSDTPPGSKPTTRRRTKQEVDDEMAQFEQDVRAEYYDAGMEQRDVDARVRERVAARRKELEADIDPAATGTDVPPTAGARKGGKGKGKGKGAKGDGKAAADSAAADAPKTDTTADAPKTDTPADDTVKPKPEGGDVGDKPPTDGGDGSPPKGGGDGKPTPAADDAKKPGLLRRGLKWGGLLAAGTAGIGLLARINSGGSASGGPPVDIPLPPGGGGGRGPGGEFVPLPVGAGGDALDAALAREAAMERALARIRGDRPSDGTRRATQVLQNY